MTLIYRDANVEITPTLVVIGGVTYAVQTINSVATRKLPPVNGGLKMTGLIGGLLVGGLGGLAASGSARDPSSQSGFGIIAISGMIIFIISLIGLMGDGPSALSISTSSGDRRALIGQDQAYLDKVRQHIEGAMSAAREVKPAAAPVADTKECPRCAETIKTAAKVCRFCGHEFEAALL